MAEFEYSEFSHPLSGELQSLNSQTEEEICNRSWMLNEDEIRTAMAAQKAADWQPATESNFVSWMPILLACSSRYSNVTYSSTISTTRRKPASCVYQTSSRLNMIAIYLFVWCNYSKAIRAVYL